jgi:uncharacterized membrane protein YfcA
MIPELTIAELSMVLAAVGLGAAIQGSIGFGYALVAAPVFALVLPSALPATLLLLAIPLTAAMAVRERAHVDIPSFVIITTGRAVGAVIGVAILLAVPSDFLSILFGSMIMLGASLSAFRPTIEAGARARFAAGVASGAMGTSAAIGGPPLALVYRDRPGPELRSTLALSFLVGMAFSLTGLAVAKQLHGWHALLALVLLPPLLLGLAVSGVAARWLDQRWLRPTVLGFAAISGLVAVIKGLAG